MSSFRTTRRVEFRDTDMAGIMHFSAFFTVLESVEDEFLRSLGLSVVMSDDHAGRRIAAGKIVAVCCRLSQGQPLQAVAIPVKIANQLSEFVRAGAADDSPSQQ